MRQIRQISLKMGRLRSPDFITKTGQCDMCIPDIWQRLFLNEQTYRSAVSGKDYSRSQFVMVQPKCL